MKKYYIDSNGTGDMPAAYYLPYEVETEIARLKAEIEAARQEEREACLDVIHSLYIGGTITDDVVIFNKAISKAAKAIRKRGE